MTRNLYGVGVVGALAIIWLIPSAELLASMASFNRHFNRCIYSKTKHTERPLTQGQIIPNGMTMQSFIDKIDQIEKAAFKSDAIADKTAITLLHWFSMPDWRLPESTDRFDQEASRRHRYQFIERLFSDIVASATGHDYEEEILASDDHDDAGHDDACFMMYSLSHTVNETCSVAAVQRYADGSISQTNVDNSFSYSPRSPYQLQSFTRQRGQRPGSNSVGSQTEVRGGTPNVRIDKSAFQGFPGAEVCTFREEGVVSITGRPGDAVSVAPVLMGIAAARYDGAEKSLFRQTGPYFSKDSSNTKMNALIMGTLGQELGFEAFFKKLHGNIPGETDDGMLISGQWNRSGCLTSFELNNPQKRVVGLTNSQLMGAVDGLILGTILKSAHGGIVDRLSLAELLRLYYSNNQNFVQLQSGNTRLSVCDRATNYHKITTREKVCLQAKLMAYGLAIKDGRTFFPENSSGGRLSFQTNPDIDAYVNDAYNSIRFDDSMKDLNEGMCQRSGSNVEQCWGVADVYVLLDTRILRDVVKLNLQADILGRILNGMEFHRSRNAVQVFAGRSGSTLLRIPDRGSPNIASSGCPACIAQYLDRFVSTTYGSESDADLINALNETLRVEKEPLARTPKSASAAQVILYFRMTDDPIVDREAMREALFRLRIGNPELKIIGIGDQLGTLSSYSEALSAYELNDLAKELSVPGRTFTGQGGLFSEIQQSICETGLNLRNPTCRPDWLPSIQRRGASSDPSSFSAGIEPKRVQFLSYDTRYFFESKNMRIKFTPAPGRNIRVCDASWKYNYNRGVPSHQSLVSNSNSNRSTVINVNKNKRNDNHQKEDDGRPFICQETNNNFREIYFNYSSPCRLGPLSCAPIRFAVVGIDDSYGGRGRTISRACRDEFCQSPFAIPYTVTHEGMVCAANSLTVSSILSVATLIFLLINRLF
ncbi:uncharacterized protein LOC111266347 isoform X2 [Varroa jacobsoni]|uniref:uncharacterized protein LOC111266347 isoform X2 n=1 Tax=Varroa jacobsoni TaxID=62625 RepID=UPI000BF857C9|nr:uncharacterized protein LOC111266347 isoform X2 [Varroa jacobsoni]